LRSHMALEGPSIAILTPLSCLSFTQISKKPPIPYITIARAAAGAVRVLGPELQNEAVNSGPEPEPEPERRW